MDTKTLLEMIYSMKFHHLRKPNFENKKVLSFKRFKNSKEKIEMMKHNFKEEMNEKSRSKNENIPKAIFT